MVKPADHPSHDNFVSRIHCSNRAKIYVYGLGLAWFRKKMVLFTWVWAFVYLLFYFGEDHAAREL